MRDPVETSSLVHPSGLVPAVRLSSEKLSEVSNRVTSLEGRGMRSRWGLSQAPRFEVDSEAWKRR